MKTLRQYFRDERGAETLEWILVGGLLVGVAIALYPGVLEPGLSGVMTTIVTTITGAM